MKLNVNFEKFMDIRKLALALALVTPLTLSGCSKKADCNISVPHAHKYVNEMGFERYINRENIRYDGYDRCEEYRVIEGEEDLYKFLTKKDLLRIDDNLELINSIQESQDDYIEYRYSYTHLQPIPHTRKVGKTTTTYFTYIPRTRYSWTSDPNHSRLTGETRLCHYVYVAYKIEKNEKGKYVLIPSEQVDDIREVMDEYPYISKKYIKVVNINGEEVDYEDGKEEELTEEEQNRIEEYEESQPTAYYEEKGKTLTKTYT